MSVMLLSYPSTKGYTKRELAYFAICLGYPSSLFLTTFKTHPYFQAAHQRLLSGKRVSAKVFLQLLDSKTLDDRLEKLYNKYPAKCNLKLIKKAHSLLENRALSFKEISDARIAFELYACEDGSGMQAEAQTVLTALKMTERVISPHRLEAEVQKHQETSQVPGRFQVFEFLDFVVMCETVKEAGKKWESLRSGAQDQAGSVSSLPDFSDLATLPEQGITALLNEEYRGSLRTPLDPSSAILDSNHAVDRMTRRVLLARSAEQLRAITPPLEQSMSQLKLARSGHTVFTSEQIISCSSRRGSTHYQSFSDPLTMSHHLSDSSKSVHSGISQRKALQFHFRRLPNTLKLSSDTRVQNTFESAPTASAPSSRSVDAGSDSRDLVEVSDLPTVIDSLCVASVLRARQALRSSFESSAVSTSFMSKEPKPLKHDGRKTFRPEHPNACVKRCPSRGGGGFDRQQFAPVVSQREVLRQQGLIEDLRWRALRRSQDSGFVRTERTDMKSTQSSSQPL